VPELVLVLNEAGAVRQILHDLPASENCIAWQLLSLAQAALQTTSADLLFCTVLGT
jgi:hypothetical protein